MTDLLALFELAEDYLLALALSSVRLLVVSLFLPMFKPAVIKKITYLGVMLAIASPNAPSVLVGLPHDWPLSFWLPIVAKEAFIGLIVGFIAGTIFWAADAVGVIIDQQTGSTQSSVADPLSGHPNGPSGEFLTHVVTTLALTSGAFLILLGGIYDTYVLWPVLSIWPVLPEQFGSILADEFSRQFALVCAVALPFLVVLVFVEVTVGFVGRAMPSLDGHSFAQGLKQLMAQLLLLLLLGAMFARLFEYVAAFPVIDLTRKMLGK